MGTPASVLTPETPKSAPVPPPVMRAIPLRGATQDWCYASLLEALSRAHGQAKTQAEQGISPEPEKPKPTFSILSR